MRLQHLQLIQQIAETGSLRAAAERMHLSQPALTKSLRNVEEELGVALVTRSPRGARLTAAGELLSARAAVALREIQRAREEVAWHVQRAHALISVGVSPAAAAQLIPGALAHFRTRWPRIHVRLLDTLYPQALGQLRSGEIDLAIGPLPKGSGYTDIHTQLLFASPLVVAARRTHPLRRAHRLAALDTATWLLTGPAGGPGDQAQLNLWQPDDQARITPVVCESFSIVLTLLREMDVLALMPQGFFDYHAPAMGLIRLPIRDTLATTPVYAMWRADAPLSAPAQRLLDAFTEQARGLR